MSTISPAPHFLPITGVAVNLEAQSLGDLMQADGKLNEKAVMFALLRRRQPDFIWDCRNDFVEWRRGLSCNVLLNKYQRSFLYTSKVFLSRADIADIPHGQREYSANLPRSSLLLLVARPLGNG
jgi:hypothetical protein